MVSGKGIILEVCAEPLGSNPANGTLLELAKVIDCVRSCAYFLYYANTINRQHSGADTPKGQPQAVPAVQFLDPFPFSSTRLTIPLSVKPLFSLSRCV